ncbi:MAG: restriction endonuclease subunit S [Dehalococcoidales bacterium]
MTDVSLNDVIDRIKGNEDRNNTSLLYYVGGEHYVSNSIELRNGGLISEGVLGFKFHFPFRSGDVLFMARNPHLQKAARVDFDGICSDASYILRSKNENILLQDFLPLIVQSDHFWSFFRTNKTGSVNPLLNWSTLSTYKFNMPSLVKQRQYADLVWTIQYDINKLEEQLNLLDRVVKSQFIEMFGDVVFNPMCWPTKEISKVAPSTNGENTSDEEHNWLLNLDAIEANTGIVLFKNYVSSEELSGSIISFSEDHVLYSKLRPYLNKVVMPDESGFGTSELIPLLPDVSILNRTYLARALMSDTFVQKFTSAVAGTKMPRVLMDTFRKFLLPLPPIDLQIQFADFVKQVDKSKFELQQHIDNTKKLQKTIINSIFQEP